MRSPHLTFLGLLTWTDPVLQSTARPRNRAQASLLLSHCPLPSAVGFLHPLPSGAVTGIRTAPSLPRPSTPNQSSLALGDPIFQSKKWSTLSDKDICTSEGTGQSSMFKIGAVLEN